MFSPGSGACEAAVAMLVSVLPALASSGLLADGATVLVAVVGTATVGVATGLAGEVPADVAGVVAVVPTGFVVASAVAVVVESEATGVAGARAGAGRGTAGVAGLAELDDEAVCIPARTSTRSICG